MKYYIFSHFLSLPRMYTLLKENYWPNKSLYKKKLHLRICISISKSWYWKILIREIPIPNLFRSKFRFKLWIVYHIPPFNIAQRKNLRKLYLLITVVNIMTVINSKRWTLRDVLTLVDKMKSTGSKSGF